MSTEAVVALDIGTSSVRAILLDTCGAVLPDGVFQRTHTPLQRSDGTAELDADSLVESALACLRDAAGHPDVEFLAVGCATFWHSVLGVDAEGRACTPVYLWSDTRSALQVEELRRDFDEKAVHARTGCLFHTSYLPARLLWLKETDRTKFDAVSAWMSPGEYLYLRIFGERVCSVSMASGTGLLNGASFEWDEELLGRLQLPGKKLSKIVDIPAFRDGMKAEFRESLGPLARAPWYGALGDGACSNVGSGGVGADWVTLMVGTSGAVRVLGGESRPPAAGLWRYYLDRSHPVTGGALSNGGAVFEWLQQTLRLPPHEALEERLSRALPTEGDVVVLPFLLGERSPDWLPRATGGILGLTAATTPEDLFVSALQAVSYRFMMVYQLVAPFAHPDHRVVATGAALRHSPAWAQMLADAIGRPMAMVDVPEGTARGVGLVLLREVGSIADIAALPPAATEWLNPNPDRQRSLVEGLKRHRSAVDLLRPSWI